MPTEKKRSPAVKPAKAADGAQAVVEFLRGLDHPLRAELETVRELILDASPAIREGIKWNAPSFRTSEYFATFNLREKNRLRLILHFGAKVKDGTNAPEIVDPDGLLEWLAKDRCMITLRDRDEVKAKAAALQAIVRQWITHLPVD